MLADLHGVIARKLRNQKARNLSKAPSDGHHGVGELLEAEPGPDSPLHTCAD